MAASAAAASAALDCAAALTLKGEGGRRAAGQAKLDQWSAGVLGECDERLYAYMFGEWRL